MESPSATAPESTIVRELLFGLAGGGIAIGCLLPPLLHFVTGPLGPFIGGFIATNLARPESRGRTIIAVMTGTTVAAVCALTALGIALFSSDEGPPSWFPDGSTLGLVLLGVWAYSTALAAAGAAARSMIGATPAPTAPEAASQGGGEGSAERDRPEQAQT